MRSQLFKFRDRIHSVWFIPSIMAGVAVGLAFVSVAVDDPVTAWLAELGVKFTDEAAGASDVLGIVAGSMISVAGVVFSMTLVALSLASSQLGPRLLRSFMRDPTTQIVLGTFIATFLFCLVVLRTIRREGEAPFVPHLSVTIGVLLAVASVGVLIYFIHHVSLSIQANEIAARIGRELNHRIDQLFPNKHLKGSPQVHAEPPDADFFEAFEKKAGPIGARGYGYVQFVDVEALLALALKEDLIVRLERRPGSYVVTGYALAMISPASRVTEQLTDQIHAFFVLGNQRDSGQDIEFEVNQLVEIAIRALSPGLNDPFTAITCMDHLGAALCRLASREMPSPYHYDSQDQLRLIAPADTFVEVVDSAFNQIRQYCRSNFVVTTRLLQTIGLVAGFTHRSEDRDTLLRHAEMIARGASEGLPEGQDRDTVDEQWKVVRKLCQEKTDHD